MTAEKISEIFKKAALFGIGAIALSQEKIEEFTTELIKQGEMNKEEGKKFVMEVLSEKDRQRKEMEEKINQKVKDMVGSTGVATKKDIDNLSERMSRIETAFEKLKSL